MANSPGSGFLDIPCFCLCYVNVDFSVDKRWENLFYTKLITPADCSSWELQLCLRPTPISGSGVEEFSLWCPAYGSAINKKLLLRLHLVMLMLKSTAFGTLKSLGQASKFSFFL